MNIKQQLVLPTTFVAFLLIMTSSSINGQEPYRLPPADVTTIIDAAPAPAVSMSPDGSWMLLIERDAMPSIDDVSRRMLRLAGTRIDPVANSRFRTGFSKSISIRKTKGGEVTAIPLPDGAKLAGASWSHRSNAFAVTVVTDSGSQLWVASTGNPTDLKKVVGDLSTVTTGHSWMPDGKSILCNVVPSDRGQEPEPPTAPAGPNVQESSGNESPTRTSRIC